MPSSLLEPVRPERPTRLASSRRRVAGVERPLLVAGLALLTAHLLDLSISGAATTLAGLAVIVGLPLAWLAAQPRVTRPTRVALAVVVGLLAAGFGVASHGLHVVNSGADWRDLTGVGYIVGGLLLALSGLSAIAAPRRGPLASPPRAGGSPASSDPCCSPASRSSASTSSTSRSRARRRRSSASP